MATTYSLICWGGKDGKTTTNVNSGTDTLTINNHGLINGTGLKAQSAVNGLNTTTPYYARSTGANTFTLHTSAAGAIANTGLVDLTGTTNLTFKSKYYADRTDKSRWTGSTERIYNGLQAWRTARYTGGSDPVGAFDVETCEIAEAFDDITSSTLILNLVCSSVTITPTVEGVVTSAFHNGTYNGGFRLVSSAGFTQTINLSGFYHELLGITVYSTGNSANLVNLYNGQYNAVKNCFLIGNGTGISQKGANLGVASSLINCVIVACTTGVDAGSYGSSNAAKVFNNTVVKCTNGFTAGASTNPGGFYYNNVSVGNTTNWTTGIGTIQGGGYNGGASGNAPWYTGSDTGVKTLTADNTTFKDYTNNDFRPAGDSAAHTSSSPLTDAGTVVVQMDAEDIGDDLRPNYKNGSATAWDIGAFEFDWGYGLPPEVHTIDFSGLVAGSQVIVYTTATTTELFRDNNCSATESYDGGIGAVVDYTILKAGYKPIRVTGVALTNTSTPVAVQQEVDRAYAAPSGLTFGTNVIVNVTSRVVTSLQVTTATTVQNWYSYLMDCWIDSATNTTLKNVAFPVVPFGEASFTVINGIEFSDGATSISKFKRDGLRYSSDGGVTVTAIWAAILTLNTPAGFQIKYRQTVAGSITNAANTGPMDQLVQIYGDGTHGNFDYRGHMVLRCPKPGYSQPKPDLVATYGYLYDGLFVAALEPVLQYATTNADIDAANLALNNTAKTFTVTANHTLTELYQRAQWWANQDAQWDADIPLTTTDGSTFTLATGWTLIGPTYLSGGTIAGGAITLAAGTQAIAFSGMTITLGAAGTYTFTMAGSSTVIATPSAPGTYDLDAGSFNGTLDLRNASGTHAITVQVPAGTTYTTANNTGAAITVTTPTVTRGLEFTGLLAGSTLKVFITGTTTELFSDTNTSTTETWSEELVGSRTVDYTILKDGYLPIRTTGVTVTGALSGGVLPVSVRQVLDRAYS